MGILHIINVENLFIYLSEAPQSVYIYLADTFFCKLKAHLLLKCVLSPRRQQQKSAYLKRGNLFNEKFKNSRLKIHRSREVFSGSLLCKLFNVMSPNRHEENYSMCII